jgi:signal transduction histidine kinase
MNMVTGVSTTRVSLPWRLLFGLSIILLGSLAFFSLLMRPPASDLRLMTLLLAATVVLSGLVGYAAYRLGWMELSPALRWTLLVVSILSSLLTYGVIWLTARLMFTSQHDLLLATVLLVFATGISIVLGYFFSSAVTDRIQRLRTAAGAISQGDLSTRAAVSGRDELAGLGQTFNEMASQLQFTQEKQQELESLRRDLIAWASHDLQTPMTSIRAILEALADGIVEDEASVQRYFRTAQREIEYLSLLIDDLFRLAQLDTGGLRLDVQNNSLGDLISDTLESFSELARQRGVALGGSVDQGLDPVRMDAARIGRVLDNLVGNALRHTPPGGSVQVNAHLVGDRVRVEVVDNGEGISSEDLPHIFERFYRGEKSRSRQLGGTGLGLVIARGIVEAHGGEIGVVSQKGEGATFYILMPRNMII